NLNRWAPFVRRGVYGSGLTNNPRPNRSFRPAEESNARKTPSRERRNVFGNELQRWSTCFLVSFPVSGDPPLGRTTRSRFREPSFGKDDEVPFPPVSGDPPLGRTTRSRSRGAPEFSVGSRGRKRGGETLAVFNFFPTTLAPSPACYRRHVQAAGPALSHLGKDAFGRAERRGGAQFLPAVLERAEFRPLRVASQANCLLLLQYVLTPAVFSCLSLAHCYPEVSKTVRAARFGFVGFSFPFFSAPGSAGVAGHSESSLDRRERLRRLALEVINLETDPYFMKNHLGSYECKLCLTLHTNEGSYLAHTQGKKHQTNLARRAALDARYRDSALPARPGMGSGSLTVKKNIIKIGRPGYKVTKVRDPATRQVGLLFHIQYPEMNVADAGHPRHRFMSAYEQKVEPANRAWQYLIFAAEPYENISFKIQSREIDK
ncbi:MAG: hypothetical protein BJ554DRAFT_305, partial [Olpidium bornovanus]